ncbi:MAG TPA: DUF3618 domain-containing protein [Cellulomonas sp.]
MTDDAPRPSIADLEAEILRTRAELAGTADALAARLDPRRQAAEVAGDARRLLRDAVGSDPEADPARRTRSRLVLAAGVGAASLLVALVVRRR